MINDPRLMLSQMTQTATTSLAEAAQALGDKIDWSPLGKGRSAFNQLQECAGFALLGTYLFENGTVPPVDADTMTRIGADYDTPEKALHFLSSAATRFSAAIEALPAEKLSEMVTLPFGPNGMTKSLGEVALMAYWNTVYHEGQINYIQTLCEEDKAAQA